MFSKFLKSRPKAAAPDAPAVPDGTAVWAIGDIHGRLDLLEPLVAAVLADAATLPDGRKIVVFLGDYIDRGADSRGVIRFLKALDRDAGVEWRFLKGNHEDVMLRFLGDPTVGAQWCTYGGDAALRSWGLKPPTIAHRKESWAHLSDELAHRLSPEELAFLEGLELSVSFGDYFFVHAGARSGQSLESQSPSDMMWIRSDFLDSTVEFDKVVVHGHTPVRKVYRDRRRIALDTKAYSSGVLTAMRFRGRDQHLIQAIGGEAGIEIQSYPASAH